MFDPNRPKCIECATYHLCQNPCIQGEGSETPEVLFVGEAPGADEDLYGRPFVGKAGNILREMITALDLKSYRITNTVRCRPSNNKLKGHEIECCKSYLIEEILKYKPKLIVTLGAVPLKAVTGVIGITKCRGELQQCLYKDAEYNPMVLPTWHPAATFYDLEGTNKLEDIVQDLNLIPDLLKASPSLISEDHLLVDSLDKLVYVVEKCQRTDRLSIDTETTGLNVYKGAEIFIVSASWAPGKAAIIPLDPFSQIGLEILEKLGGRDQIIRYLRKFISTDVPKYFQNARFDIEMLEMGLGIQVKNLYGDTMIAQFLADETAKRNLEYMTARHLRIYQYKSPVGNWIKENHKLADVKNAGMKNVPRELLYPYAAKDADYTRRLSYIKEEELAKLNMTDLYFKHLMPLVRGCIDMREAGIKIDFERVKTLETEYTQDLLAIKEKMMNEEPTQRMLKENNLSTLTMNSAKQLSMLLFDYLGLPMLDGRSTNKKVLFDLAKTNTVAEDLLKYRKIYKMYSTFVRPMHELSDSTGFVRPEVLPDGTKSGRTSCRNPNLQQSPWDSRVRGIFCTRFVGGKLALLDYSQIELRIMAMLSGDINMSRMYTELDEHGKAKDFHKETAALVYDIPIDEVQDWQRRFIKTVNFGIAYGRGAEAIAEQFNKPVEECRKIVQEWWEKFPQLRAWVDKTHLDAQAQGCVWTPYGRRRLLPGVYSSDPKVQNNAMNASVNTIVQGTAADVCDEAMMRINKYRRENNCRFKIVMVIHDSIMFDIPPEEAHLIDYFQKTMESVRYPWMRDIPATTSVKVAENWGDMEEMVMHMEGEGQDRSTLAYLADEEEEELE